MWRNGRALRCRGRVRGPCRHRARYEDLKEQASRLAGERFPPQPPVRVRAGWEHRIPALLDALEDSSAELIFRRDVERMFGGSRKTAVNRLDRFGARSRVCSAAKLRRTQQSEGIQKKYFSASCSCRMATAVPVTVPNPLESIFPLGDPQTG